MNLSACSAEHLRGKGGGGAVRGVDHDPQPPERMRQGGHQVFEDFGGIITRGEKIVLVGRNGAGKTTMLRALLSDAPGFPASPQDVDAGKLKWGHEVAIGYFPQDHTGLIKKGMTAAEWLHQFDPDAFECARRAVEGAG